MSLNAVVTAVQPTASTATCSLAMSCTTSSSTIELPAVANPSAPSNVPSAFAVWNAGSGFAFVAFGSSTVTAAVPTSTTLGSFPISPGAGYNGPPAIISVLPSTLPAAGSYMAGVTSTSTATLYVVPCTGNI